MNLASLGQNIRKYRAKKGMRQEDLAEKVGLSSNILVLWKEEKKYRLYLLLLK